MKKAAFILSLVFVAIAIIAVGAWAAWYSYNRQAKIAEAKECQYEIVHPKQPVMMTAPDGSLAPVYSINTCMAVVVPPPLWNLIRGHVVFEGIPERMKVNSYTLSDVLLGRYTLGPNITLPCDQSATTTDCATLPPPSAQPQPYIPPNAVQPLEEWTSATGTPITLSGFSFFLPPGWHGEVYDKPYAGGRHVLIQESSDKPGFVIDCPPDGKGLEAATRLSTEERTFTAGTINYSIAFEKWTAPGNEPWYFVWVRAHEPGDFSTDASGIVCLAEGSVSPDAEAAMEKMYETWK